MDRLRLELLLGRSGGETREAPTGRTGGSDDAGSNNEEMSDRAAEPGPSEQPPETAPPNDDSQADDEFTVMDVDEEQPEDETSHSPRKRGRFENERSDSMSEGEGASQQHTAEGEPMTYRQERAHTHCKGRKGRRRPPTGVGARKRQARGKAWTASAQETEGQRRERGK